VVGGGTASNLSSGMSMPLSSYAVYGHDRLARYERATPSTAGKKLESLPAVPYDNPTTNRP
jgi:hypothetical protein